MYSVSMVFKLITLLSVLHLVLSRGTPNGNNTQNADVAKDGSDARSLLYGTTCSSIDGKCQSPLLKCAGEWVGNKTCEISGEECCYQHREAIEPIKTCEAAGGTCMSLDKAMKKCTGTKSWKFWCSNDNCHICCINGCPDGFFLLPHPANQCLKFYDYSVSWDQANSLCTAAGLELAKPLAPALLREYMTLRFGSPSNTWLQAKGDGSNMVWADGQILGSTSPMWRNAPNASEDNCLLLLNEDSYWNDEPEKPYLSIPCSHAHKFICEVTLETDSQLSSSTNCL